MASPFPARSQTPLESSAWWLTDTLLGGLAIGLCIIAVAIVGLLMMSGRLPVRQGAKVALGCFVLLGAPIIASGFLTLGEEARRFYGTNAIPRAQTLPQREELPPSTYDPYAGASIRDDR